MVRLKQYLLKHDFRIMNSFNSNMVRLKQYGLSLSKYLIFVFQFQHGTIKAPTEMRIFVSVKDTIT